MLNKFTLGRETVTIFSFVTEHEGCSCWYH